MIKFQNQPFNYDMFGSPQMPQQGRMPMQQPMPRPQKNAYNQNFLQETFGQQQISQPSVQQPYQQPAQNRQSSLQHANYPFNQQQKTQPSQQQQTFQPPAKPENKSDMKPQQPQPQTTTQNQPNQRQESNQIFYRPPNKAINENAEAFMRPQKNSISHNMALEKGNTSYIQAPPPNPHQRLQSADPTVLQNRSNYPAQNMQFYQNNKGSQYMSNGTIPTNKMQYDNSQRGGGQAQATPMKDQVKCLNQKSIPIEQQFMYSPMPKSQQLSETANLAKLQHQQLLQNRSPQIQKVGGSSGGAPVGNAQLLVEELSKEKEKNLILQTKLRKLEADKKVHNTQFLNDMESKIKSLIQQNDQLQTLNMDLLQKAQDQPMDEIQDLNKQIAYNTQQNDFLGKQIAEAQKNLNEQVQKYAELERQLKMKNEQEEQQIQYLVLDLEEKVHGLISENERLNMLVQQQESNPKKEQLQSLAQEKNKLIQMTNQSQKDLTTWRQKYEQLSQKIQQAEQNQEPQDENIENLEDKIRALIEENDYLNMLVQQQIEKENQIALLEEEQRKLQLEQNDNLELLVQSQTQGKK